MEKKRANEGNILAKGIRILQMTPNFVKKLLWRWKDGWLCQSNWSTPERCEWTKHVSDTLHCLCSTERGFLLKCIVFDELSAILSWNWKKKMFSRKWNNVTPFMMLAHFALTIIGSNHLYNKRHQGSMSETSNTHFNKFIDGFDPRRILR